MKKNSITFPITIILSTMLTGCSQTVDIPSSDISTSSAADPMQSTESEPESNPTESSSESQEENEPNGVVTEDISFGLRLRDEDIKYENGKLVLTPALLGDIGSARLGVMVFIDGILQEYTVSDTGEKTFIAQYNTIPSEETHLDLTVDTVLDDGLNDHYILLCALDSPDFVPDLDHPWYGHRHDITNVRPQAVSAEKINYTPAENLKIMALENSVMTKEQIAEYTWGDPNEPDPPIDIFQLTQEDNPAEMADRFTLLGDETSLTLKFVTCMSDPHEADYRVGFFKNHIPCKFNGENDFMDITIAGGKITETEITIDDVEIGDVIYCIAFPKEEAVIGRVKKTESSIVIGEVDHTLL